MVGIYRIQNNINGKVYIGQSTDIKKRWKSHKRDLQKGEHPNPHLQKAWNLYGEKAFSFDVLEKCRAYKLNELERYYIKQYDSRNPSRGYNIAIAPGRNLTGPRPNQNRNAVIISEKDAINNLCLNCDYDCKQSDKNEIIMCKKIAEVM